jgi:hypothetical protein
MSSPLIYDTPLFNAAVLCNRLFILALIASSISWAFCVVAYFEKWRWKGLLAFALFQLWLAIAIFLLHLKLAACFPLQ